MDEYKKVRLGDVLKTSSGGTPSKKNNDYYQNGTIPWILSGDISQGHIKFANNFITELGLEKSSAKYFPKNTILVAMYGATVGQVGVLDIEATTNQAICGIFPNEKFITNHIYYFFKSQKEYLLSMAIGGAQPNISQEIIKNLEIPLPPIETQKQIATTLDKVTKIITENKTLLEKYDLLIKSRFIEMFGDPVINPMGWEVKKLGTMCTAIMNGTTPKGGEQVYVDNGITFLRSQNVWRNRIDLDDVAYIDEATHKSMKKSSLKKYDILMTKTGRINTENSSLGRAALFMGEDDSANINGHVYLIRLEKEYNHDFIIRILTSPEYRDYIRSVCVGGIDKRQVNKDHIEDFPIIQPPKAMQEEYATFVQQIDKSKFVVQKSLEKAETLYKSLMQEYFG